MRDMNNIKIPGADISDDDFKSVQLDGADLSKCTCSRTNFSLSHFQGTNFNSATLQDAIMICAKFSNETILKNTDVSGLFIILSTCANKKIDRNWLVEKGAHNTDTAITNLGDLKELIKNCKIELETAKHYMQHINELYGLLNSIKIRKEKSFFMDKSWLSLLEYSTGDNLETLKQSYLLLSEHCINLKNEVEKNLSISELKKLTPEELIEMAEELGMERPSRMPKNT